MHSERFLFIVVSRDLEELFGRGGIMRIMLNSLLQLFEVSTHVFPVVPLEKFHIHTK